MLQTIRKQCIRANKQANIVYLNNPKVGCSTVKSNLWRHISPETFAPDVDVHSLADSPFLDINTPQDWMRGANVFTFVRDPFARLVSAYLNKIKVRNDGTFALFAKRFGVSPTEEVSFDRFVEILSGAPPEQFDGHWRPQHINIMYPFVRPDFLGHLETMDTDLPRVLSKFLNIDVAETPRKSRHSTGADDRKNAFFADEGTLKRTLSLYEKDFEFFGYSTRLDGPSRQGDPIAFNSAPHVGLDLLMQLHTAPDIEAFQKVAHEIAGLDRTNDDRFTSNWKLQTSIQAGRKRKTDCLPLIRANMDEIGTGYSFLRETCIRIATAHDASRLVQRLKALAPPEPRV